MSSTGDVDRRKSYFQPNFIRGRRRVSGIGQPLAGARPGRPERHQTSFQQKIPLMESFLRIVKELFFKKVP